MRVSYRPRSTAGICLKAWEWGVAGNRLDLVPSSCPSRCSSAQRSAECWHQSDAPVFAPLSYTLTFEHRSARHGPQEGPAQADPLTERKGFT